MPFPMYIRIFLKLVNLIKGILLSYLSILFIVRVLCPPEKGNWTNAHLSPNKLSGSSIGKGLSNDRSGLDPF